MARVGSFTIGDGTLVGDAGLTTPQAAAFSVLAGYSPYYPSIVQPIRTRRFEIWGFDPTSWLPTTKIPHITAGASRSSQLTGVGFQQDSLAFTVAGPATAAVAAGAWICVRATIANNSNTLSQLNSVYRCIGAPSPTRLAGTGAATQAVRAVDWAQPQLALQQGSGWQDSRVWETARVAYVAAGQPLFPSLAYVPDNAQSWGTVLAGLLTYGMFSATLVDLAGAWPTAGSADLGSLLNPFLQIGDPSKPLSGYDQLTFLWPLVGGFSLGYQTETGHLVLNPGGNRIADSGYFVTVDNTVGGGTPLPWTSPLVRTLQNPAATKVQYFYQGPEGSTPAGASSAPSTPDQDTAFRGEAVSSHPQFPYDGTLNSTLKIVETGTVKQAAGFETFTAWCEYKLRTLLAAADTLSLKVDCAVPPPPLGTAVRVHAPPDADGWYRLVGVTQPLSAGLADYKLEWWSS